MLTAYKITCKNGYSWKTNMAAHVTLEMAKDYFMGQRFNVSPFPGEDMQIVTNVEEIKEV